MIVILGSLRFPPQNMAQLLPHLRKVVEETRKHDGCVFYDAAEDVLDPGLIRFSEAWPDEALLQKHLQAPHMAPWREAAGKLGVSDLDFTLYTADGGKKLF